MNLIVDTVVPFSAEGPVDLGAVRAHTLWLLAHGVDGFAPAVGEFLHVDRKEREKILEVVADVARGHTLLACIWDPSPAWCVRLGRAAADRGATAVLVPPPLLVPVHEDTLLDWYASVAEAVPIPVLGWHQPAFGNPLTPRLCQRLLAETRIAGWLDASGDLHRLRRLARSHPGRVWAATHALTTADEIDELAGLPGLLGGVSRLANAWPDLVLRAWKERAEDALEATAHRGAIVQRAGGPAALRHLLGLRSRLPLDGVDASELGRLPGTGFR